MNCKCAHFWGAISLLSVFLTTQVISAPYNGRFELFDTNPDFNTPTGWQHENYTAVVHHFVPNPVSGGSPSQWQIDPEIGLYPYEGNYFLTLSTGNFSPEPQYAKIWQQITINPGNKLTGAYFFGTCDYLRFDDYGEIKLILIEDPNLSIPVIHISVADVNNYGSTKGWKRFEYTFDANQAGTYDLTISVTDFCDIIYESYFAIDGLVLCEDASDGGDINLDCTTDFHDFALLAADWLCNCNDPNNYYSDPNANCRLGTDLTGDGPVDTKDLQIMSEYWLEGTKE
jgi:hypothetical protein